MITKTSELLELLMSDRSLCLFWSCGVKLSASGSYSVNGIRVYASAVRGAEKKNALKCIRNDYQSCTYVLTQKYRIDTAISKGE